MKKAEDIIEDYCNEFYYEIKSDLIKEKIKKMYLSKLEFLKENQKKLKKLKSRSFPFLFERTQELIDEDICETEEDFAKNSIESVNRVFNSILYK